MRLQVLPDADAVALEAARFIAVQARSTVATRGRFVMAISGGRTPWQMLRALAHEDVPWNGVHIAQVDERVAPAGHADRNLTQLTESLISETLIDSIRIHAMPVEGGDPDVSAADYARSLQQLAGRPAVLDLVHLGLGVDGHTASLIPGDAVLDVEDRDVAITGVYQGRRRMTLTYPLINRAACVLWVVTGAEKRGMLARLRDGDVSIPGGRINRERALVLADAAAVGR